MKRSHQVAAPLLASAALAFLAGCRKPPEMQRCVDEHNVVVDESLCKAQPLTNNPNINNGTGYHGGGGYYPFRWYYGGYGLGSPASGGVYAPLSGHAYSSPGAHSSSSSTSHGGFGSTHASGGGSGE